MVKEKKQSAGHDLKVKSVKLLSDKIKNAKTFMIIDIKGLPSPQFQNIKKDLREYALIQVAKKNILRRAIEELKKESILPLENHVVESCAFAISDLEGFELAGILSNNKTPVFAKAGQTAKEDIEIKAGPTSLLPGPAISELGALGLQISVENGKISIRNPKIVVKSGETIKEAVASLLQKLEIKPFTIGLVPVAFYDNKEDKIYSDIKINPEEARINLVLMSRKALGFAQKINYYCPETISYLLGKAHMHMKALHKHNQLNTGEDK
jgi:large subunit ribosomal protein L10